MKKRILSLLLALCLVAGMLPTVAYAYDNSGTIDSGTFDEEVNNYGTINGGTFNGAVTNFSNGIIFGGTFNSTVNNESSIIRGGTFHGAVTNEREDSAITGGTFYGAVTNEGDIEGGTFYGTVSGSGTIADSAKVTVTFDSDGGSTVDEQKVLRGQKATAPTDPTKAGYSFEGWYNGDTEFDFSTPVTENITLTAKWSIVWTELTQEILDSTYKQTTSLGDYIYVLPSGNYYLGKDISVDITVNIGTHSTPTQNVVLDLNGYELKKDNSGVLLYPNYSSTLILTDNSSAKTGKVINTSGDTIVIYTNSKLNANGGTVEGNVSLNGDYVVIDNTDPSNVTVFREGQIHGKTSNAVINGGVFYSTVGTVDNYSGQITGGIFYGTVKNNRIQGGTFYDTVISNGEITGGTFYGAVTNNGEITGGIFYGTITGSGTVSGVTYRRIVTFDSNGGSEVPSQDILKDSTATEPTAPTKAGYSFEGWYKGDNLYNFSTSVTENITLTAIWIEKSDISFNTDSQSYTYNGSAQAFSITGTAVTGFAISYKQNGQIITNPTDTGSYDVIITRAEDDTYNAVDVTISNGLVIEPATPTENPDKKTTARVVRGKTLADAAVTNGEIFGVDGTTVLTGTFAWVDSTKVMSADGTEQMVFTPDNTNYAPITIDVAVSAYSTGGGSSTPTYAPTVTQPDNGSVTVSPKSPRKGVTVTITPTPDAGYTVEQVLVTDKNGDAVEVINNGDGTYSFTQPAGKVNINVTFMEDNSMLNFFVDVFPGDYYYDAVLWAAENGITSGVDDTHFAPNAPCTRAQIVTFLWRAAGSPEPENVSSFADVSADSYYAKAVAWAVENGITTGTGDGMFSPNATCTRAQAMTFIYRSEQAQGGGMQGEWMFLNPFSDVDLENYYGEAVMWAVANGITDGTSDTTFSPGADCTRAQIVTFLYRFFVK